MKPNVGRFASLCVIMFIVLISIDVRAKATHSENLSSKTDSLTHGIFLHTHVNSIFPVDPVMQRIVRGKKIHARSGEKVGFQNGKTQTWTAHSADSTGWFKGRYLHRGYGLFTIKSDKKKVVLLESKGNDLVYVNGVPREGNKYGYKDDYPVWEAAFNFSIIPIQLKKGNNQLLFVCSRGRLKVKLTDIKPEILFNVRRTVLPNFLVGQSVIDYAAATIINATNKPLKDAYVKAYNDNGYSAETRVPLIQPMSIRSVGFKLKGPAPASTGKIPIKLTLLSNQSTNAKELATVRIHVKTVKPTATHNITFKSSIDGSVQYYSVVPPRGPANGKPKALFFSLHGADVIATNQANSYYPKTWGYIVCPTNGGPYGYDWENWGRLNALQVLHLAKSTLNIDPNRIYLTGHSMGGHGTWIIGAQYPDQFAAIGPSSGWISWWTYVFHNDQPQSPIGKMLMRASNQVNTYLLDRNYKQLGTYILHGSKDDNVPVTEAIHMADTLRKFDHDFIFHEQPGVGHWWGLNDEAGTDCVDWPPMFNYFARHARPGEKRIKIIDFTTSNPGVSAKDYWLTIYSQEKQLEPSKAKVKFVPSRNRFVGTTKNIKTLSFDLSIANIHKPFNIDLDSTKLDSINLQGKRVWLQKEGGQWHVTSKPSPNDKGPARYGTFKDAFRHDMIFVYGTHGNRAENKWAFDKARFDAEYFWYQGNGSVDIVSDKAFNPNTDPNRNVILYGNEKTNSAWNEVLDNTPVKVENGEIKLGSKVFRGKNLSCFMIRPRKGSTTASVGIVSGTGAEGMRLTYTIPYLQPWFSLPDVAVFSTGVFSGSKVSDGKGRFFKLNNKGVKLAGFFGLDWSLKNGEFVEQ